MPEQTTELERIISRLERVETENRRLKRVGLSVLVVVGPFLFMGQTRTPKTVEAAQFIVKDTSGKVRGALGTFEGLTQLSLYGPEGAQGTHSSAPSVLVGNGPQGPYLTFTDANGKTRLNLIMENDAPGLVLYNRSAEEVASINASGDVGDLHLGRVNGSEHLEATVVPDHGPYLVLTDEAGFRATIGAIDLQTARTGTTHRTSAASVVLFSKDKSVLWSAP
jgi:hypothetical protein